MCSLVGACVSLDASELPFAPIVDGLRNVAPALTRSALRELWPAAQAQLAHAFPVLAGGSEVAPPALGLRPDAGRFHEFLADLLEGMSRQKPLLVVIEDFQWCDIATSDFVRFLVQRLRRQRIAVVLTFRREDVGSGAAKVIADLRQRGRSLALAGLTPDAVRDLLRALGDGEEPAPELVESITTRAAGNPLFVTELFLARDGAELSLTLAELLDARLGRLSPAGHAVVDAAADILAPERQDHRDPLPAQALREEPDEVAGRDVTPLEVLDHHEQRLLPAHALQQVGEELVEARGIGAQPERRRRLLRPAGEHRERVRELRLRGGPELAQSGPRERGRHVAQALACQDGVGAPGEGGGEGAEDAHGVSES
jgi:hypothetical protein